jgi:flagellar motor switch protein FliN
MTQDQNDLPDKRESEPDLTESSEKSQSDLPIDPNEIQDLINRTRDLRDSNGEDLDESDEILDQAEVDRILEKAGLNDESSSSESDNLPSFEEASGELSEDDVEQLLAQAESALESIEKFDLQKKPTKADLFDLEKLTASPGSAKAASLRLLRDVDLDLKIVLGRTQLCLEDVLKLQEGSVVTLDKLAGDPVDIYANGRLIACGEVLVMEDNFCVRVTKLIAEEEPGK